ncbi:MAG: phosphotransferase family protein, partial [Saprospiraceae bacterium]|nr:phosphotransferase family protein [Saprospiraceae bacterium]
MLRSVRKGEELPVERLRYFLYEQGLITSTSGEIEVRQYSNGFSNLTYLLRINRDEFVLRRP